MKRRDFIRKGLTLSGATLLSPSVRSACNNGSSPLQSTSRIVIAHDEQVRTSTRSVDSDRVLKMLDNGLQALYDRDHPLEAWEKVVRQGEVVGLKVNCLSGRGSTHTELVEAICERLQGVGIKAGNIIIWDRFTSDLEDGGFRPMDQGDEVRCFGNDRFGFESDLEMYGSAASLVCKTLTKDCDAVINLPVLRDHSIAGVTISMKNMFGVIHNPNKYHLQVGDPYIPDVNMLPSIRRKVRLTICDAIAAQYEGGPSFMPHWRWPYNGLIIGEDPVALDYTGWQIIERKRSQMGIKSLKQAGREPTYIATAADADHGLGTNDPKRIELVKI